MIDGSTFLALSLWLAVFLASVLVSAQDFRKGRASAATLFLLISVTFVNSGILIRWLQTPEWERTGWQTSALLVTTIGLLSFLVGKSVGPLLVGRRSAQKDTALGELQASTARGLTYASLCILAASALYFVARGSLPLLQGLSDLASSGEISNGLVSTHRNARDSYSGAAAYLPGQGLLETVRYWGLPLVVLWSWMMMAKNKWRTQGRVFVLAALVLAMASGQRWPLMYLLVAVLLVGVNTFRWKTRSVLRWAGIALGSGVILSALLGRGAQGITSIFAATQFGIQQLMSRLFMEQSLVPFQSFQFSREALLPEFGATVTQNLMAYLPGAGESYPVTFSQVITGSTGFTAPPDFYTEAWINGGWPLVILLSGLWGILLSRATVSGSSSVAGVGYRTVWVTVLGFSAFAGMSQSFSVIIVYVVVYGAQLVGQAFLLGDEMPRRARA